jgi:hypothetical protein
VPAEEYWGHLALDEKPKKLKCPSTKKKQLFSN